MRDWCAHQYLCGWPVFIVELLLNLLWLLLGLPAMWLWRQARRGQPGFNSWRGLLMLGCVLILLFPIVSASDDLQAMRTEAEEPASGDTVRGPQGRQTAACHAEATLALPAQTPELAPPVCCWSLVTPLTLRGAPAPYLFATAGRSPPSTILT